MLACVVDPNQLDRFNDQLNAALPGLVSEEPLDPVIATQLVEIEKVQSCPPLTLGEVEIPRESLALRTRSSVASEKLHAEADAAAAQPEAGRAGAVSEREAEGSQAAAASSRSGVAQSVARFSSDSDRSSGRGTGKERALSSESETAARSRIALEQKAVVLVWVGTSQAD